MSGAILDKPDAPAAVGPAERPWSVVVLKNRALGVLLFEVLIILVFSAVADKFLSVSN